MSLGVKGLMQIAEKVADNTLFPVDYKFQPQLCLLHGRPGTTDHKGSSGPWWLWHRKGFCLLHLRMKVLFYFVLAVQLSAGAGRLRNHAQ